MTVRVLQRSRRTHRILGLAHTEGQATSDLGRPHPRELAAYAPGIVSAERTRNGNYGLLRNKFYHVARLRPSFKLAA